MRIARASTNKSSDLRLLWVDMTVAVHKSELPKEIACRTEVSFLGAGDDLKARCQSGEVDVLCFDFDYPDRHGLRLLQEVKRSAPKVPIIMLTLQHSESLAIWAFRSRVWDYFIKPIPENEIARCFDGLAAAIKSGRRQLERTIFSSSPQIPNEASSSTPTSSQLTLLPALNFVETRYSSKIMLDEVASLCNMNRFQFSRKFKETYHIGFSHYVLQYRLGVALQMLRNPNVSVTEVCYSVGFNDASYFTKSFQKFYGFLPSCASSVDQSARGKPLDHLAEPLQTR